MKRSLPSPTRQHFFQPPVTLGRRPKRINHHRYGEVKTRLTIGGCGDFAAEAYISEYGARANCQGQMA
jgi:hypothetical protein